MDFSSMIASRLTLTSMVSGVLKGLVKLSCKLIQACSLSRLPINVSTAHVSQSNLKLFEIFQCFGYRSEHLLFLSPSYHFPPSCIPMLGYLQTEHLDTETLCLLRWRVHSLTRDFIFKTIIDTCYRLIWTNGNSQPA